MDTVATLKEAIANAAVSVIHLAHDAPFVFGAPVDLTNGGHHSALVVSRSVTLMAERGHEAVLDANSGAIAPYRVITVLGNAILTLIRIRVTGGHLQMDPSSGESAVGGGIFIMAPASLRLIESHVTGNWITCNASGRGAYGGGIANFGQLTSLRSTITNNTIRSTEPSSSADEGGLFKWTIGYGGGLFNMLQPGNGDIESGRCHLNETVIEGNGVAAVVASGGGVANVGRLSAERCQIQRNWLISGFTDTPHSAHAQEPSAGSGVPGRSTVGSLSERAQAIGGGLSNDAELNLTDTRVHQNSVRSSWLDEGQTVACGGGISNANRLFFVNVSITYSSAESDNGVSCGGGMCSRQGTSSAGMGDSPSSILSERTALIGNRANNGSAFAASSGSTLYVLPAPPGHWSARPLLTRQPAHALARPIHLTSLSLMCSRRHSLPCLSNAMPPE